MELKRGIFYTVIGLLAFSCSKEEEDPTPDIVGRWKAIDITRENCDDPVHNQVFEYNCPDYCDIIEFKEDGTLIDTYTDSNNGGTEVSEGTYSISGDILTICDLNGNCRSSTFKIDGNILISNSKEESLGCDIIGTSERL